MPIAFQSSVRGCLWDRAEDMNANHQIRRVSCLTNFKSTLKTEMLAWAAK